MVEYPLSEFWRARGRRDGYKTDCKDCAKKARREWGRKNPLKESSRAANSYRNDPEAYKARARRWRQENPERSRELKADAEARRRARMNMPEWFKEAALMSVRRRFVYDRDKGVCQICKKPVDWSDYHMDHIHPVSRGGLTVYSNLQTAHSRCNMIKSNRII